MNIVVADDNLDFRVSLIEILEIKGHQAWGVGSLTEFFVLYDEEIFDLAIVDRMFPDGDGLEIVSHIRRHSSIPIVLISGNDYDGSNKTANSPNLFLTKPFIVQPLLAYLQSFDQDA
jgi:two-component system response regulator CpxR